MKRKVSGTISRSHCGGGRIIRRQQSFGSIKPINHHLIQAQVGGKGKLVGGVEVNRGDAQAVAAVAGGRY